MGASQQQDDIQDVPFESPEPVPVEAYSAFSHTQRQMIIVAASAVAFFSPTSGSIYFPALNDIAADLDVSESLVNLTVTTYLILQGLAPAFVGTFSDDAGRRPAYIVCFALFLLANLALALQNNYAALMVLRSLQSAGSSGTIALTYAVAADIVTSAERGSYVAYASLGPMLGPTVGPVIGGLLSHYLGYHSVFWFLFITSALVAVPMLLFFPETNRKIVGDGSIPPPVLNMSLATWWKHRRLHKTRGDGREDLERVYPPRRRARFPNPLKTLVVLLNPEAAILLTVNGLLMACYYGVASFLPSVAHAAYGYNTIQVSLLYIPMGAGGIICALTNGRLLDWNYRRHARRIGVPLEKNQQHDTRNFPLEPARLQVTIPMVCGGSLAVIALGWALDQAAHVAAPIVILFICGYCIAAGGNCVNILTVDIFPKKPATASAANNLLRCGLGAAASAVVVPMSDAMGIGWTSTVLGGICLACVPALVYVMVRGGDWRRKQLDAEAEKEREKQELQQASDMEAGSKTS